MNFKKVETGDETVKLLTEQNFDLVTLLHLNQRLNSKT